MGPISVQVAQPGAKRTAAKRELLVLLGLKCPEDEVVMLKPVRATRDLFGELTDKERAEAISQARSQSHRVVSPLLQSMKTAQFVGGTWEVDGCKWADLVKDGISIKVPLVRSPSWRETLLKHHDMRSLLDDDAALEDALRHTAAGMIEDANKVVMCMTSSLAHGISLRAVSLLRQQYVCISMPKPSLQGGMVSDQLAAYDGDWLVFRLLTLISRVVPGALRPIMPPGFQVPNPILLRVVEKWMMEGIQSPSVRLLDAIQLGGPSALHFWEEACKRLEHEANLMEHQREAIRCTRTERCTCFFLIFFFKTCFCSTCPYSQRSALGSVTLLPAGR